MAETIMQQIVQASGLPETILEEELRSRFEAKNLNPQDATLDEIRDIVTDYLQDVLCELSNRL